MPRNTSHIFVFHIDSHQAWYVLSPGWAVIAGALAVSGLSLSQNNLIAVLLLWCLIDPLLGTVKTVYQGYEKWPLIEQLATPARFYAFLPYLTPESPVYRIGVSLTRAFTSSGSAGFTLLIIVPLAILLAGYLNFFVLIYTILYLSILFFWRPILDQLWLKVLVEFLLPYILIVNQIATLDIVNGIAGVIFCSMYYGTLRLRYDDELGHRVLLLGLSSAAGLLFSLQKPFWAVPVVLSLIFCRLCHLKLIEMSDFNQAREIYVKQTSLLLLSSLVVTAIALGSF